ncbi:hypothetical protein FQN49_005208 [Arthroderma sp. PD_2]|nr:hypothetical protein FQN49_005208 [Arthroderma sp. PD_2]
MKFFSLSIMVLFSLGVANGMAVKRSSCQIGGIEKIGAADAACSAYVRTQLAVEVLCPVVWLSMEAFTADTAMPIVSVSAIKIIDEDRPKNDLKRDK